MLETALQNALLVSRKCQLTAHRVLEVDGTGSHSPQHSRLATLWRNSAFWVQQVTPSGLPIFVFPYCDSDLKCTQRLIAKLELDFEVSIRQDMSPELLGYDIYRKVHVIFNRYRTGFIHESSFDLIVLGRALAGEEIPKRGCEYALSYNTYAMGEFARTEQEFAYLGVDPWSTLRDLLDTTPLAEVVKPIENGVWSEFVTKLRSYRRRDRNAAWVQFKNFTDVTLDMKHRHYIDLVSLLRAMALTWNGSKRIQDVFWDTVLPFIRGMLERAFGYERILLFGVSIQPQVLGRDGAFLYRDACPPATFGGILSRT